MTTLYRKVHKAAKVGGDFWVFARQVAFAAANRHEAYSRLLREWEARNPEASWTDHEQAAARIAQLCRV